MTNCVPPTFKRAAKASPELLVNTTPGVSLKLMDQPDSADIDAVIMIRPPFGLMPDMTWQPLMYEPFKLIVHNETKGQDWRALLESQPFLRYERTSFGGRLVTGFLRENRLRVQESMELDEIAGLMNLVFEGLGLAFVPMVEAYLPLPPQVRAISLGEKTFYRDIGMLRKSTSSRRAIIQALERCLLEAISPAVDAKQ